MLRLVAKRMGFEKTKARAKPASGRARNDMQSGLRRLAGIGIQPTLILDVGASDGQWTHLARPIFPQARYALFEPQPVHAPALQKFAAAHPRDTVIPKAVSASVGITFFDASAPYGGALMSEAMSHSIEVPMTTIDKESTAESRDSVLIKLDTHGFEKSILDGAANTLRQTCALIIEAYNYRISAECLLFWELCAYLAERGFRPIDMVDLLHRPRDNTLWQSDIFFIRADWPGFEIMSYA